MAHEHKLVFIREFTGEHKVYWCRECGLIVEFFGERFAEMLPEWSQDRLLQEDRTMEKYAFVKEKIPKQKRRLGRSLKDLMAQPSPNFNKLLTNGS